jgi:hypothetical protein
MMTRHTARTRTLAGLLTAALASVALAGCAGATHGDPYAEADSAEIWVALGGDPDDTVSGSSFAEADLPAIEPAQCTLVELVRSGSIYTLDDLELADPGWAGNVPSPSAELESDSGSDIPGDPQWYATARIFGGISDADQYMNALQEASLACSTYTTSFDGEAPTTNEIVVSHFETGGLPSVAFNEAVVLQKENVVFVMWPASDIDDLQPDLNAFVNAMGRF